MDTTKNKQRLPKKIVDLIRKAIYPEYQSDKPLDEDTLLKLSDILFPYYPPDDNEKNAVLTLQKWRSAQKVTELSGNKLDKIIRTFEEFMYRQQRGMEERRYYEERRHWEERRENRTPDETSAAMSLAAELASSAKELAQQDRDYLKPFVDEVATSKQCLSMYVFRIVAQEKIEPEK